MKLKSILVDVDYDVTPADIDHIIIHASGQIKIVLKYGKVLRGEIYLDKRTPIVESILTDSMFDVSTPFIKEFV